MVLRNALTAVLAVEASPHCKAASSVAEVLLKDCTTFFSCSTCVQGKKSN